MQILIAGAGRGIGLALVRRLLAEEQWTRIYALHRQPSPDLDDMAFGDDRLKTIQVDLDSDTQLQALPEQLEGSLNWVINTTGLLHSEAQGMQPEKSLQHLNRDTLQAAFQCNAINHLLLLKVLQPFLVRKEELKVASLSAKVGSIGDNRLGGWYAYRASKAALNQLMHSLAIEMRRSNLQSVCVTLHPGTTDTELSQPFQERVPPDQLFSTDRAATQLLKVLKELTPEKSGEFFSWNGEPLPW